MAFATDAFRRLTAALRAPRAGRNRVRDRKLRPGHYDGTETPDLTPPYRYARGTKPVPPPPPSGM